MPKSKDEIMEAIKAYIGEDTSDEAISLVSDVSELFDEVNPDAKYTQKDMDDLDKSWRQKYRDRFFAPSSDAGTEGDDYKDDDEDNTPSKFEDLFITKE